METERRPWPDAAQRAGVWRPHEFNRTPTRAHHTYKAGPGIRHRALPGTAYGIGG